MELNGLHDEMRQTWGEFRGLLEQQARHVEENGKQSALLEEGIAKAGARLDELETKLNRLPAPGGETAARDGETGHAFFAWARRGALGPEERKLMTVADDTTGGYLAPAEFVNEVIRAATEYSPIRGLARVRQTSARAIQVPKKTGSFSAAWSGETETVTDAGNLTFGLEEIPTHRLTALVKVSQEDLEDAAYDLAAELRLEFGEQFGIAEGQAFLSGSSVGQPQGILSNGKVAFTASGSAAAITGDGLIDLQSALKEPYSANGTWV